MENERAYTFHKINELRAIQKDMTQRVILKDCYKIPLKEIAGIDMAFLDDTAIVACSVLDFNSQKNLRDSLYSARLNFPYIPTLLSFREGPPIIEVINSINPLPDIFLINSHGIAHPFFLGCASYVGVITGRPIIGVAAQLLCGEYAQEPKIVGEGVPIFFDGKNVGWVIKTKIGSRPLFISPGHMVSLQSSLEIIKKCLKGHKLPEPLFRSHKIASEKVKKKNISV